VVLPGIGAVNFHDRPSIDGFPPAAACMTFPSELQKSAIEAALGPVLVIAGPGAGKTSCLVARIEYLIHQRGFKPDRLCAVTFTNKAAEEIVHRLKASSLGRLGEEVTRGTIHSLCLDILREQVAHVGLQAGFGVADENYQLAVLGRLRVPRKYRGPMLNRFGRHRLENYELTGDDPKLFARYVEMLHGANMADFDDLVVGTAELFRARPDIAEEVGRRWDYVLVDECQDLNPRQYEILSQLVSRHRNIFAVGDDEQSIFSWASADPRILMQFRQDFAIPHPIILDENCRCSRRIFTAARRLIERNPPLFDKSIRASRESGFEVETYGFPDEEAEADWIVSDLLAHRSRSNEPWGEYGLLYRKHETGERLETRLLTAGIPCLLSRGHAISDDKVIAQVLDSLRLMEAPEDLSAIEALADRVLPPLLLDQVRTRFKNSGLLAGLRLYAREHRGEPDAKKAWRFIYAVENLRAIRRAHQTLTGLISAILSQGVGEYGNPLERESEHLTDPVLYPGAGELAGKLSDIGKTGGRIWIVPARGLELALRGMLVKAGYSLISCAEPVTGVADIDLVLDPNTEQGLAVRLFKALQLGESQGWEEPRRDFVAFDLETTDNDVDACEVVEIGAVRVRDGVIVEEFQSLVRPSRAISPKATEVHGYGNADLVDAPSFAEAWARFRTFVRSDILVAHNGFRFDVPVLRRMAAGMYGSGDLVFYDSLPLARSLSNQSAKLGDLAVRFGVPPGRSHHALDDAIALAQVYGHLNRAKLVQARKAALSDLLDCLGLGLALTDDPAPDADHKALLDIARYYTLGRFGESLVGFQLDRSGDDPTLDEVISRLGGKSLMERLREQRSPDERYPAAMGRLRALSQTGQETDLGSSIQSLLDRVALSRSDGADVERDRVNLLTLHATKGLEFGCVYVVGVEDNEMPGNQALTNQRVTEIEEARRLLYVGMTRAKDRLVLTRAERRGDRDAGGSMFLQEIGIELTVPRGVVGVSIEPVVTHSG
jgi:DNA polymerase III epsilon subunit family exonuclease